MAVTGDGALKAEGQAATKVFRQALAVRMNGPDSVEVGKKATFQIEITNTGNTVLKNVTMTDRFPAELVHADGESSPIVKSLDDLQPGQKVVKGLTFVVTRPGQHSHRLDVTADGDQSATARGVITGIQSQTQPAKLQLRFSQPQQVKVGETAEIIAEVTNIGGSLARNAQLSAAYSASFKPDRATPGHEFDESRRLLTWTIDQLPAGSVVSKQINLRALVADDRGFVQVNLTPEQGPPEARQLAIAINEGNRVTQPMAPMGRAEVPMHRPEVPLQPRDPELPGGNLEVTMSQSANPIPQGKTTNYIVRIKNNESGPDEALSISLVIPDGLKFKRLIGGEQQSYRLQAATEREVQLTPISLVRARENLPALEIEVEGTKPGMHTFQVEVRSKRNPKPIVKERTTTVNMPR